MRRERRRAGLWSGIRGRVLKSYLLLMLTAMSLICLLSLLGLQWYYQRAMGDVLRARGQADQQYFARIEQEIDLTLAGQDLARELGGEAPYRVQIYRADGRLVGDSTLPAPPGPLAPGGQGSDPMAPQTPTSSMGTAVGSTAPVRGVTAVPPDVQAALAGRGIQQTVARMGDEGRALHLTLPLQRADRQVAGALRYSTSLKVVDHLLRQTGLLLAGLTLLLLLLTAAAGVLLARTVVRPVTELTRVAEAMAAGELGLRARLHFPDEVGRLAATLNRMATSLGELDQMRSDFLRAVSHDLRTPLAAIKAWVVTLQDEEVEASELAAGLNSIEESADHLARLVEDLLVAARLQAGTDLSLHPKEVAAGQIAQTVCHALHPRARTAGIELTCSAPDLPPAFFDPDRLAQIVGNLIENAIKFTPRGGRVSVTVRAAEDSVLMVVRDTGRGIAPADLPRVTTRFFRGQGATSIPGTGLGLAIVTELLRQGGGELQIASQPGAGTTATVRLPIAGRNPSCA